MIIESNTWFYVEKTRYSKYKYRVKCNKNRIYSVLKMPVEEVDKIILGKFKGEHDNITKYKAYRFDSEKDAMKAYDWINSIFMMNQLSGE